LDHHFSLKLSDQCGIRIAGKGWGTIEQIPWNKADACHPDGEKFQILSILAA